MAVNSLTLSWAASTSGTPPITYQPQFRVSGTTTFISFGPPIAGLTVVVTGLSPSTNYDFDVIAINSVGTRASTIATGTTAPSTGAPPTIPANVVVSQSAPGVSVGPAASGTFVNIDFAVTPNGVNTGAPVTIVPQLFGGSSATIGDVNFGLLNNTAFQSIASSMNTPLLRLNCNTGGTGGAGNPWLNLLGSTASSFNTAVLTPMVNNLKNVVNLSTCKTIIGFGGGSGNPTNGWTTAQFASGIVQVANYLNSAAGGNLGIMDWEIMNEWEADISQATYNSYFVAASNALKAANSAYRIYGPVSPDNAGDVTSLLSATTSGQLSVIDMHKYLYCPGVDPVPTDTQCCQGVAPYTGTPLFPFAADINPSLTGTGSTLPCFMGEYQIGCGPNDAAGREQTIIGACFVASAAMYVATQIKSPTLWAGVWEWGVGGGWGTFVPNTSWFSNFTSCTATPVAYYLSKAATTLPGTIVSTANPGGQSLNIYATKSGTSMGVLLVNYSANPGTTYTGQVALSHWPLNPTGNGTIHMWTLSPSSLQGSITTLTVTAGVTASISIPPTSIVILYP